MNKLLQVNGPKSHSVNEEERKNQAKEVSMNGSKWDPEIRLQSLTQADFVQILITGIFGGHIRSVFCQQGSK